MSDIERILEARDRDLGDIKVGRVLPAVGKHFIGPFVFLDHMHSDNVPLAVRPHPHLHLATVTYLFEGEITHRDSLGSLQRILPGEINWMSADTGIVHSERNSGQSLHGIQIWVALPHAEEDTAPFFEHTPASALPEIVDGGARMRVLAGSAYGATSPVRAASPMFYVDVQLREGASIGLPNFAERAAYVIDGAIEVDGQHVDARKLAVFNAGSPTLRATRDARFVLVGGEPLGPRYIWWNFVSSSKDRIVEAAERWRAGKFPTVPGDDVEFIPAPDGPRFAQNP